MHNKLTKELAVCGFNSVSALGTTRPEIINRLFLREDQFSLFTRVCQNLAVRKRPYKLCGNEELERICKSTHHQGVVAMIEEPEIKYADKTDLDQWVREGKTGLVLHSLGNDHNLGSIVQSAAFFDAHFIILSEADTEARLSTSAYQVAEGGMEYVVFRKVRDTGAFLRDASKVLITIGAEPRSRWRIRDLETIIRDKGKLLKSQPVDRTRPGIALVVGNEKAGLPLEIKDHCSALVRIPGTGVIESLNAAHTATLFLHELYDS